MTVSDARTPANHGFRGDERGRDRRRQGRHPPPASCRSTQRRTRRRRADPSGPQSICAPPSAPACASGGEILAIATSRRVTRPPPLVVLCDISGIMSRYAQILLHFLHAVANDRERVHVFLFGTRLSNITRQLRHRDPEVAFQLVVARGAGLVRRHPHRRGAGRFNRRWARRVLGQGAVVLLVTDGLDRDGARGLAEAMERLHKSCRRLVWLNPLLRWDGFAAKIPGHPRHAAACGRVPPGPQSGQPARAGGSLSRPAPPRGDGPLEDRRMNQMKPRTCSPPPPPGAPPGSRWRWPPSRRPGAVPPPGRQPHGGHRERADGRLGLRRLHRGRRWPTPRMTHHRRRRAAIAGVRRDQRARLGGRAGLRRRVKVFVERLA